MYKNVRESKEATIWKTFATSNNFALGVRYETLPFIGVEVLQVDGPYHAAVIPG